MGWGWTPAAVQRTPYRHAFSDWVRVLSLVCGNTTPRWVHGGRRSDPVHRGPHRGPRSSSRLLGGGSPGVFVSARVPSGRTATHPRAGRRSRHMGWCRTPSCRATSGGSPRPPIRCRARVRRPSSDAGTRRSPPRSCSLSLGLPAESRRKLLSVEASTQPAIPNQHAAVASLRPAPV